VSTSLQFDFRIVNRGRCLIDGCEEEALFLCPMHQLAAVRYELCAVLRQRAVSPHCPWCGRCLKNNGQQVVNSYVMVIGHPLPLCAEWQEMRRPGEIAIQ